MKYSKPVPVPGIPCAGYPRACPGYPSVLRERRKREVLERGVHFNRHFCGQVDSVVTTALRKPTARS